MVACAVCSAAAGDLHRKSLLTGSLSAWRVERQEELPSSGTAVTALQKQPPW